MGRNSRHNRGRLPKWTTPKSHAADKLDALTHQTTDNAGCLNPHPYIFHATLLDVYFFQGIIFGKKF